MLHVIAIILSILFIVILIVTIIIFIIINGKSNVDNVPKRDIDQNANHNKANIKRDEPRKKRRHRKVRSCKSHTEDSVKESKRESDSDGGSNILDVCCYSKYTIYLLVDHTFQVQESEGSERESGEGETRIVKCNLHVTSIASFEGHLYALANGRLYKLDNNTLESNTWSFVKVTWSPENVVDISVPHDKKVIWVRCKDNGYVYDREGNLIDTVKSAGRRIYGIDENNYITIHNGTGVLQPGNKIVEGIRDAVITHEGELFTLGVNDKYKMIKMIDWKPYYII